MITPCQKPPVSAYCVLGMSLAVLGNLTPADLSNCIVHLSLAPTHTNPPTLSPHMYTQEYKHHTHHIHSHTHSHTVAQQLTKQSRTPHITHSHTLIPHTFTHTTHIFPQSHMFSKHTYHTHSNSHTHSHIHTYQTA